MGWYRKRAVEIEAIELTREAVVETLEGKLVANAGDWLITGVEGEKYPCPPDVFERTYEHVSGSRYRKLPVIVDAIQLTRCVSIETEQGVLVGSPGDWFVSGVQGSQYPCAAGAFEATYESVDGDVSDSASRRF